MMSGDRLKEILMQSLGLHNKDIIEIFICNVDAVDEDSFTCDCTTIGGDAPVSLPSVQLSAEINDGVHYIPEINSTVVIALSTRNKAFVILFSAIQKVLFTIKNGATFTTFSMQAGLTQFNDGSFDGLVKVQDLVNRLNLLENAFNSLVAQYNVHIHTGGTISGSTGAPTILDTSVLIPTVQADVENPTVTHGI